MRVRLEARPLPLRAPRATGESTRVDPQATPEGDPPWHEPARSAALPPAHVLRALARPFRETFAAVPTCVPVVRAGFVHDEHAPRFPHAHVASLPRVALGKP